LLLALLLGGVIGHGGSAADQCSGGAGFGRLRADRPHHSAESSPTRMAAQVVSGIGLLGAWATLRQGINMRGLIPKLLDFARWQIPAEK